MPLVAACAVACSGGADPTVTREYFIAAVETDWDYAPLGVNGVTGEAFSEDALVFVGAGTDRVGSVYRKALYREYTDDSFTVAKEVAPEWRHLGLLGPLVRAEVGDTIVITFQNQTSRPASVHPHGVLYAKDSEGTDYGDGTDPGDGAVPPGETYVYTWEVPERAGPGPADGSSVFWMYHSHVDEPRDTNAGLIGPMIVTARGEGDADARPLDVDREVIAMFSVMDENTSWYLPDNVAAIASRQMPDPELMDDEDFHESNLMHSINGYVFANGPVPEMAVGERVRWYLLGMGTEVDLHTPHWHGQSVLVDGARTDIVELLPASMLVADMVPDNPGRWLYHCHVNDHITAGMIGLFDVLP